MISWHTAEHFTAIIDFVSQGKGRLSSVIQKPDARKSLLELIERVSQTAQQGLDSLKKTESPSLSNNREFKRVFSDTVSQIEDVAQRVKKGKAPHDHLSDQKEVYPYLVNLYRLHCSDDKKKEKIGWKEFALFIEQHLVRQEKKSFFALLDKIKKLSGEGAFSQERKVYLSYALPSFELAHEHWTYAFVQILFEDLELAGLEVSSRQRCQERFADFQSNRIVLIGTQSFFNQYQEQLPSLKGEVNTMQTKLRQHTSFEKPVLPVLISGRKTQSFPPEFQFDHVMDVIGEKADRKSYPLFLKELLERLYSVPAAKKEDWEEIWNTFWAEIRETSISAVKNGLTQEAVEDYLEKHIEFLNEKELEYQKMAAQSVETLGLVNHVSSPFTRRLRKAQSNKFHVPVGIKAFIGREEELQQLQKWVMETDLSNSSQLVVIHGESGMGKQELAIQFAHTHSQAFSVVFWLDASSAGSLRQDYLRLAKLLEVYEDGDDDATIVQKVNRSLEEESQEPWLLIFKAPKRALALPAQGGAALVLSCEQLDWQSDGKLLELGPFSFEEALQIFDSPKSKGDYQKIFAKLGGVPAHLQKAQQFIHDGCTLAEFIECLEEDPDFLASIDF